MIAFPVRRRAVLAGLSALAATPSAAGICLKRAANLAPLESAMAHGRYITYEPTTLKAVSGVLTPASDEDIRADLLAIRPWFDGLITYGAMAGGERIPDIAAALDFRSVIVGVWDPSNETEIANALAAWRRNPKLVHGLSLGNEVVLGKRGTWAGLAKALDATRAEAAGLPLAVTEPFAQFLDEPEAQLALARMDFMLVNIHPIFETWFKTAKPENWAEFVTKVVARLENAFCGPIIVKETGTPSGPPQSGYSQDMQAAFWAALAQRMKPSRRAAFSYFSAFDEDWRASDASPVPGSHPEEAHWGLFGQDRGAKPAVLDLRPLKGY